MPSTSMYTSKKKNKKHQIVFGIDFKEHNYNNYIQDA